ncbi:hypothetical protein RvY_12715 [Ramazzottius varieornatus]|uniref:Kinetochore protein NDC80 n=1 Tax=Ramazzottius varieornatus TaxID=947166 RepID=A0A1D1VKG0_RAMVA|nr:hypothetical protein RvY_12715 [Ramazzottius varieornatus]
MAYRPSNYHPRESNIYRSSSMSTGMNYNPNGAGMQHNHYYGSALDMSVVGNGGHSNRPSLLSSTPLARKLNEAVNTSVIHSTNGNGHYQSSQPSTSQGGYLQDGHMGRPTASISGMSSFADRQSMAPFTSFTQPSAPLQDPRPTDKHDFRKNVAVNLFQFLQGHGFDWQPANCKSAFSEAALNPASRQTFEKVFEFLIKQICGGDYSLDGKKIEVEVMSNASKLGYPFANLLKPNVLKAPNIPNAVPVVCGFLDWLREEAEAWEVLSTSGNREALESGYGSLFHRAEEGMGPNGKNIENVFHNARLTFMAEAYNRAQQNPTGDGIYTEDILDRFKQKLDPCVDTSVDLEGLQAELVERAACIREKTANYESLDKLKARLEATEARIAQAKKKHDEEKSMINRTEHELMKFAADEKQIEQDNQQLSKQMEEVQKQIRRQKISKDEHLEKLAKQEELRAQIRAATEELESMDRMIVKRKQNQQRYCAKLQDSVQILKLGLVQMDDTARLDKLSDYTADQDVTKYMADVKAEVTCVVSRLRSRSDELRVAMQRTRNELADLEKKREPLHANLVKTAETEKTLQLEIETLKNGQDTSEAEKRLEEKKRALLVDQQMANGQLDAAKTGCQKAEHRYEAYAKAQKKIKEALALRKAADVRLRTEHVEKQQSRCKHLEQILAGIENSGNEAGEAVADLQRSMLNAMQGQ